MSRDMRVLAVATGFIWLPAAAMAAQPTQQDAAVAKCKAGDRKGCEAVGIPKELAGDLAGFLRDKKFQDPREARFLAQLKALANPDADTAAFRVGVFIYEFDKRIGPERLHALVLSDPDEDVRRRALGYEKDQATLGKVATTDSSSANRLVAVGKLSDPAALEQLATTATDSTVRLAALGNPAIRGNDELYQRLLGQVPESLRLRSLLASGYWILEPGADFHLLGVEPAANVEVLKFEPAGTVLMLATTIQMGRLRYEVIDSPRVAVRIGRDQEYGIEVTSRRLTLTGPTGKASYAYRADIYH
jgi:hypothetical protein